MSAARSNQGRSIAASKAGDTAALPGQVVLVLQGGGALGAYQLGVYQSMSDAGIAPNWVVGTSIGAINGALIAGNRPKHRLQRLHAFWDRMKIQGTRGLWGLSGPSGNALANLTTVISGLPGFFRPNPAALLGTRADVGIERAAYYDTAPLRQTLTDLVDWDYLNSGATRLTVGAVNARTGVMTYFDSRNGALCADHIMASCALPPAFPAVRIDGEPHWDGGIYSNTPSEVVFNDQPRKDSVIFAVQLWNPEGNEPRSLWHIQDRQKDIQFSSRDTTHVLEQQKIHKLRHIIRELVKHMPAKQMAMPEVAELAGWGCGTTMHIVQLIAPRLQDEDHFKDIDFTHNGIKSRWEAGQRDGRLVIEQAPWRQPVDPRDGVVIHHLS
jgi:NTE family protein